MVSVQECLLPEDARYLLDAEQREEKYCLLKEDHESGLFCCDQNNISMKTLIDCLCFLLILFLHEEKEQNQKITGIPGVNS